MNNFLLFILKLIFDTKKFLHFDFTKYYLDLSIKDHYQ